MIFPVFPKKGDLIGVCAPSSGVGHKMESFDRSLDCLKAQGYKILETGSVRNEDDRSADAETRGREFDQLMADRRVRAVISASGGDYNIEMLPYIDSELVRENPKWIVGASDPTNILYYVTTKLDIATMYGFNAGTFDWVPIHQFQKNAISILKGDIITQESFSMYQGARTFGDDVDLDTPVRWRLLLPESTQKKGSGILSRGGSPMAESESRFSVTGRLIGGCSDCILNLLGTPYDGTGDFLKRYGDEPVIWYLDDFAMDAPSLLRFIIQMEYCGYMKNAAAIVIGRVMFQGLSEDQDYLDELAGGLRIPVIFNADIGHVKPAFTLINGATGTFTFENGKGSLAMKL